MLFPVNNPSEQFFCLNKQQCKCYVYSRHSPKVKGGFKVVGRGGHTTPLSLKIILHHFYRQIKSIIMFSWQVYRPPLSEFSGSAPANVCNNVHRKVHNAT